MEFTGIFQATKHILNTEAELSRRVGDIIMVNYCEAIKRAKARIASGEYKLL